MQMAKGMRRRDFLMTGVTIGAGFALGLYPFRNARSARAVSPASVYRLYAQDVYEGLGYRPTWLPGTPVELGDIGEIKDGVFRYITNLNQIGIHFDTRTDSDRDAIDYASRDGVTMTFKAGGEVNQNFRAITEADAGLLIEFSRKGAVVMHLRNVSFNQIADQHTLADEMLRSMATADESRQWQRNWVVITEVARAQYATIVISGSENSRIELRASGSVSPASLAEVSAAFSVATESGISARVIAESGLTPLYRGLRVKARLLGLFDDEVVPAHAEPPPAHEFFGEADPADDDHY